MAGDDAASEPIAGRLHQQARDLTAMADRLQEHSGALPSGDPTVAAIITRVSQRIGDLQAVAQAHHDVAARLGGISPAEDDHGHR